MIQVNSLADFKKKSIGYKNFWLFIYKGSSENSLCAYKSLNDAVKKNDNTDIFYADIDPASFSDPDGRNEALQLPGYGLVDASLTYKYDFNNKNRLTARFSMNNVLDNHYISESETNIFVEDGDETWNGINTSNRVFFGWGRSWNVSLRFEF